LIVPGPAFHRNLVPTVNGPFSDADLTRGFQLGQAGFLGTPFHWTDVLVVAAWGLAGLLFSVRFFSWEPRT
jgi:hypothetical protein